MRFIYLLISIISVYSCDLDRSIAHNFSEVHIETVFEDSVSIRAIELDGNTLMFTGSNGMYGVFDIDTDFVLRKRKIDVIDFEGKKINFRAIASTETDFFLLSIESPALLYKINKDTDVVELVLNYIDTTSSVVNKSLITSKLKIFPIPTTNQLTIELTDNQKGFAVEVINSIGQVVDEFLLEQGDKVQNYNSEFLPDGVYYLLFNEIGSQQKLETRFIKL